MVDQLVEQFLARNSYCPLPGIGTVKLKRTPASMNRADSLINGPEFTIILLDEIKPADDIVQFIASRFKTDIKKAAELLNDYCKTILALKPGQSTLINLTGEFKSDENGSLSFHSFPIDSHFFPAVDAQRVIHPNAIHHVRVGDQEHSNVFMTEYLNDISKVKKSTWWMWSAAIAALALGVMAFHFYRSGFTTGNAQSPFILSAPETYQTAQ
jgi:hypothetical protein